jgi:endoglucanase
MSIRLSCLRRAIVYAFLANCIAVPVVCSVCAQGVAKVPLRNITAKQLVLDMKVGWNLGNTLDAPNGETAWGNPVTTQAMMDAVKAMGFKTVRIPVTWDKHMGSAPNYTVDQAFMDRVETIANYVLRDSMYAIINTHHDEWVTLTTANQAAVADRISKLWTQIATRFKDYSDYLVFETFNEPRQSVNEWNGGTPEARAILNSYHQTAVSAIRATGGNNASRFIMICGHAATPTTECVNGIVIPNSNDVRCVVSLHTYYPQDFSFPENAASTWGSAADQANVIKELDREKNDVSTKGGGTAVIGEWGSTDKGNLSSREAHAEFYARETRSRGMVAIWWDNGVSNQFGILNRKSNPPSWVWPTIAQALVRGANNAAVPVEPTRPEKPALTTSRLTERAGKISYALTAPEMVSVRILTLQGKVVTTLVNSFQPAGEHAILLAKNGMAAGPCLLEFKAGDFLSTKKLFMLGNGQ